jgi:isoleucyl-tRNA synthetase
MLICTKDVEETIQPLIILLQEEINVKAISFHRNSDKFMSKQVKPKFSVLGPRFKEKAPTLYQEIGKMDPIELYNQIRKDKELTISVDNENIQLTMDDFEITEQVNEHIARTETNDTILLLDTHLTEELEAEGFAREIVRRIQSMRKELDLAVESTISTSVQVPQEKQKALEKWIDYIKDETRSESLTFSDEPKGTLTKTWNIDEIKATVGISP